MTRNPSVLGADFVDWNRLWQDVGAALTEDEREHARDVAATIRITVQYLTRIERRLDRAVSDDR